MKREGVVREHADGVRGDRCGERGQQPAAIRGVSLCLTEQPAHRAHEEPEEGEKTDRSGLEQRSEPLIVEDRCIGFRPGRDARAEPLSDERLPLPLADAGPQVGQSPATGCALAVVLLGDESALRKEGVLDRPDGAGRRM